MKILYSIKTNREMKFLSIAVLLLMLVSCKYSDVPDNTTIQNVSVLVQPIETDIHYASGQKRHYIVRNNKMHINKLLLFIGGSFSAPKNYRLICDYGATIGLDVISLSYPNHITAASLKTSKDKFVFDHYRDEICFGNSVSNAVEVDVLNSINTRTIKLLEYLAKKYPNQNWSQYLTKSSTLQWDKIIVSGHSQGSGHASYLGKKNKVGQVAMFSGPNDYSTFYNAPANWLFQKGETPLKDYYCLLHTKDQIVPFDFQKENLKALGMLAPNQNPTLVDNLSPPYKNAHALSINISAISKHNSTIGRNSILPKIWTYMFTTD